jgi:hypothetical protein
VGVARLWVTHNFVDSEAAMHVGIIFSGHDGLSIAVANGDHAVSSGCCTNLKITITNDEVIIDCYRLSLESYEMILSVQWWIV